MTPAKASHTDFPEHSVERYTARLARVALGDTIFGGTRALNLARRADRFRCISKDVDSEGIVADVYSASTGEWHREHQGWECPECGTAVLGIEAAYTHCEVDDIW